MGDNMKGKIMSHREFLVTERDVEAIEKRIGMLTGGMDEESWESVRRLHEELSHARVLHDGEVPDDIVTMNTSVMLEDVETGRQRLCTLVYPGFIEGGADRVSVLSPMGTALLGARVGDMLEYEGAAGPERARIADIVYQPEAAGHSFL